MIGEGWQVAHDRWRTFLVSVCLTFSLSLSQFFFSLQYSLAVCKFVMREKHIWLAVEYAKRLDVSHLVPDLLCTHGLPASCESAVYYVPDPVSVRQCFQYHCRVKGSTRLVSVGARSWMAQPLSHLPMHLLSPSQIISYFKSFRKSKHIKFDQI
jgi:hypothetical protein